MLYWIAFAKLVWSAFEWNTRSIVCKMKNNARRTWSIYRPWFASIFLTVDASELDLYTVKGKVSTAFRSIVKLSMHDFPVDRHNRNVNIRNSTHLCPWKYLRVFASRKPKRRRQFLSTLCSILGSNISFTFCFPLHLMDVRKCMIGYVSGSTDCRCRDSRDF